MTNAAGDLVRSLVWWSQDAGIAAVDIDGDQDSTGKWCRGISIFGLEGPARITADDARRIAQALLAGAAELDRLTAADELADAEEFAAKADVIVEAMKRAGVSTLGELFEGRGKGGDQ